MEELAGRQCVPCRGGVPPLEGAELDSFAAQLPNWQVANKHHLNRRYETKNFRDALGFVNRISEIAEQQNHHPDINFGWGYVEVSIWTHKINGLTESDFILAAKLSALDNGGNN